MNTRINGLEHIVQCLRTLESYGYDTVALWREHNEWLATLDERKPTDLDRHWATRADAPTPIEQHFIQELRFPIYANDDSSDLEHYELKPTGWRVEKQYRPELLSGSNCFKDRQYTLTPGQRDVLRTRHGLTPAAVVVVTDVALFTGTSVVWSVTIKSAEHIDPRRRKHVLSEVVIAPASKFFQDGAAIDKAREAEAVEADLKAVKKGAAPTTARVKALQYFD